MSSKIHSRNRTNRGEISARSARRQATRPSLPGRAVEKQVILPSDVRMTIEAEGITTDELRLAARNSGMPLEALRWPITPLGLHYLLIHYDIPQVDAGTWQLEIGGRGDRPGTPPPAELQARERRGGAGAHEGAGHARAARGP